MKTQEDRIFEEMTQKVTICFQGVEAAHLECCKDHSGMPLREHFDEGYLECETCGRRITLEQARTIANDALVTVSEMFDRLNREIELRMPSEDPLIEVREIIDQGQSDLFLSPFPTEAELRGGPEE